MHSQYEEKKRMGYALRAESCMCIDCVAYTSTITERSDAYGMSYQCEGDMLCAIGGFVIKKNATCNRWTRRVGGARLESELSGDASRPPCLGDDDEPQDAGEDRTRPRRSNP